MNPQKNSSWPYLTFLAEGALCMICEAGLYSRKQDDALLIFLLTVGFVAGILLSYSSARKLLDTTLLLYVWGVLGAMLILTAASGFWNLMGSRDVILSHYLARGLMSVWGVALTMAAFLNILRKDTPK